MHIAMSDRTRWLLEAPALPVLARLAVPNLTLAFIQIAVSTGEAWYISRLGAHAIAGVSLVFPIIMLMQTMSSGGMGGGVASAVARALGGGRKADADALVTHAIVVAILMAAVFTTALRLGGPALYRLMGGEGPVLSAALSYSNLLFSGALAYWLMNILANVLRGTGNMRVPATVIAGSGCSVLLVAPAFIFGLGPLPPLGVAGAALAAILCYGAGAAVFLWYLRSGRSVVRLSFAGIRLHASLFAEILRVGAPSAMNNTLTSLTASVQTGFAGAFGASALAGFGLGMRLQYLQIPLVFGFGSSLVALVGTNVGAARYARAERIAWIGSGLAAALPGAIGLLMSIAPDLWLGLFTADPAVLEAGRSYFRTTGPFYAFFGLGMALYFASQGAGRVMWALLASVARLAISVVGGWIVLHAGGGLAALFWVIAVGFVVHGGGLALAVRLGAWQRRRYAAALAE